MKHLNSFTSKVVGLSAFTLLFFSCLLWLVLLSDTAKNWIVSLIFTQSFLLLFLALCFSLLSFLFIRHLKENSKKTYIQVKVGEHQATIYQDVIHKHLENFWKALFPERIINSEVKLSKDSIEVIAELPEVPVAQQKDMLGKIEHDLQEFLQSQFGYYKEFLLTISFQETTR
ncbi:MAG: hypothetical protein GWP59_04060 [Chlamydiales bacterium]|nr:hypothetical protein [Chlamydiales bacterium]NCF70858.1 hypothetical protein [Chlamydiales bacterium]